MIEVVEVRIWNRRVGAALWNENRGYASFEYDPGFLRAGYDIAPLMMPLEQARSGNEIFSFPGLSFETFNGLPGLLADSLPDLYGTRLIDRWLAEQGREPGAINPIERLCYTGKRGMGALEYKPALRELEGRSKSIEIERLVLLASQVLTEREQLKVDFDKEGLMEIIRVGTSAGGARAKAVIAYNKDTGDVRSGQIDKLDGYDYWILKLDGVTNKQLGDPEGYGEIEYAYYLMARDCGINMMECDLKREGGRAHFMTKRFDRVDGRKIHQQSLCALAHFDFNDREAYSYEQAFQVLRQLNLPYPDHEELFRRVCFNVVARNQDDHTKNISFLMDTDGIWRLSPAYDMTYAYNPERVWTRSHQMSINGKRDDITRADILDLAGRMNIKKADEILNKVVDVVSEWSRYAGKTGVRDSRITAIQKNMFLNL